jgi:hypothetical protein
MNNWISNQINWNNLKPKKTCLICNINKTMFVLNVHNIILIMKK